MKLLQEHFFIAQGAYCVPRCGGTHGDGTRGDWFNWVSSTVYGSRAQVITPTPWSMARKFHSQSIDPIVQSIWMGGCVSLCLCLGVWLCERERDMTSKRCALITKPESFIGSKLLACKFVYGSLLKSKSVKIIVLQWIKGEMFCSLIM